MNEDYDRSRRENSPHNLVVLRHWTMKLAQTDPAVASLHRKLKRRAEGRPETAFPLRAPVVPPPQ